MRIAYCSWILFVTLSLSANSQESTITIRISEKLINHAVSKKLPWQGEYIQEGSYDVIRGTVGNWLNDVGLGGIDKIPYSVTLKTRIDNAQLHIKKNEIRFTADGNVSARNFSDTEKLEGRCSINFNGKILVLELVEANWPIDVNIFGLTGDIPIVNYDLTKLVPAAKRVFELKLPEKYEFDIGGIPLSARKFKVSAEEKQIVIESIIEPNDY